MFSLVGLPTTSQATRYRHVGPIPISPGSSTLRFPPDHQYYMGKMGLEGFSIATADVLKHRRRDVIAMLMPDRVFSDKSDEDVEPDDELALLKTIKVCNV